MKNNSNPRTIISDLLKEIDYLGDREKYADELMSKCLALSMSNLVNKLPDDQQAELMKSIGEQTDQMKAFEMLKNEVGEEMFYKELRKVMEEVLSGLIKAVVPTLSEAQKSKLVTYLGSIQSELS